jgi:hypothetical protein
MNFHCGSLALQSMRTSGEDLTIYGEQVVAEGCKIIFQNKVDGIFSFTGLDSRRVKRSLKIARCFCVFVIRRNNLYALKVKLANHPRW